MAGPVATSDRQQRLIFFGDQTVDALPCIKILTAQAHRLPALRRFLRDAADVIQVLLSSLEFDDHDHYRRFETICELAEIYSKQDGTHETIACALWTTAQFGDLVMRAELNPSILTGGQQSADPTYVVGICGGLLPAAATATARDINELLDIGRKLVAVAFRLGVAQWRRAMDIEGKPGRWAVTIVNVPAKQIRTILDAFNEDMEIPKHRQFYISFLAKGWVTVSGPPSLFPELWAYSSTLNAASKMQLPLGTPAHAAHLPPVNVSEIVGTGDVLDLTVRENFFTVSTSTCQPFQCQDLGSLLQESLRDITGKTLNIAGVNDYVISALDRNTPVRVSSFGPASQIASFKKTLEEAGYQVELDLGDPSLGNPEYPIDADSRDGSNLIAVVGQSVRFPGSEDVETFWENIKAGRSFETEIPASRFDLAHHYDATGSKTSSVTTKYGSFLENPGLFDNRLFNVSPREAKQMDPIQRILMMCSYEALQAAGYSPDGSLSTNSMRIATYFGQSGDDWRQVRASQEVDIYYIPGTVRSFAPGKLNYHYKWGGGNYAVDSACAASTTTMMLASQALLARDCDMALAGGGQLNAAPEPYAGLSRAGFLSKTTGGCKTFREDADGYCRGEGVGVVVLKRLEDALAENDNVLAVIRGADRNFSWDATSITHPSVSAQVKLVKSVLRNTGVEPEEIGFVEMHGTGTQAGDGVEMETVTTVFGSRPKDNPLYVGAVKANIGHGEAAAGVASVIKAIEVLRHRTIPTQAGFPGPRDPKFNHLDGMNIRIPESVVPFQPAPAPFSSDGKRKVLVNNFDASGGNNCVLLEEAPARDRETTADPRGVYTVAVSARTTNSLKNNISRLLGYLQSHPDASVADVAYTTTARRMHEDLKKAYTVQTASELVSLLQADLKKDLTAVQYRSPHSVVFAFTGQGAQYAGMGKQLFDTSAAFRESVQAFHELAVWQGFPEFLHLIADDQADVKAADPVQLQLAVVVLEMALANLWKSWGVEPGLVVGYSLGEYPALYVAGVLSVHDVIFLVGNRARLMQERCESGSYAMLATQSSPQDLEQVLGAYPSCAVACKGAPRSTVVSGPTEDITQLHSELKEKNINGTLLNVPYGFHCAQVDPILDDFRDMADGIQFNKPRIPVASSLEGTVVTEEGVFSSAYLVRQTREPVNFIGAVKAAESSGRADNTTVWIEIGPKRVLSSLVKSTLSADQGRLLHTIDDKDSNWKTIAAAMTAGYTEGMSIKWPKFHKLFSKHLTLLELPTYAFDLKDYWIPPAVPVTAAAPVAAPAADPSLPVIPVVPGFPTASLQQVRSEQINGDEAKVTFETVISHPALLAVIRGHRVGGVDLFPASGFMDMAFSAAKYIHHRTKSGQPVPEISMKHLAITHPLTPSSGQSRQIVIVTASKRSGSSVVDVSFRSRDGSAEQDHGDCKLHFDKRGSWDAEWAQTAHFINAAKKNVIANGTSPAGTGHRLPKSVVYKLFSSLVEYSGAFRAMEEVYVTDDFQKEAVASVVLPGGSSEFYVNPYWSDALIHVCGFLLNSSPNLPSQDCFLFNGLEEMRLLSDDLQPGIPYTSYVYLTEPGSSPDSQAPRPKHARGDVYVFQGEKIVGVAKGVVFQRLTRRVLATVLGGKLPGAAAPVREIAAPAPIRAVAPAPAPVAPRPVEMYRVPGVVGDEKADAAIGKILARAGANPAHITDATTFAEIGFDSLEWIELVREIRTSLDLEVPASFFFEYPKVNGLRRAISELSLDYQGPASGSVSVSSSATTTHGMTTPSSTSSAQSSQSSQTPDGPGIYANAVIDIVLSQTGFDKADLLPTTRFDDMGLDSLCTMEVVGVVREQTGLDLPASFFHQNPTVAHVRRALGSDSDGDSKPKSAPAPPAPEPVVEVAAPAPAVQAPPAILDGDLASYHCDFFLMQGSSDSTKTPLFFLPDGTGYPAVLLKLPPIFEGDNALFTCKSPLLNVAEGREVRCTIEGLAAAYAAAIQRARPHGPYLLAGYSLGGAYAFEVAKILADAGEVVQGLLFVDFNMAASVGKLHRDRNPVPVDLTVGAMEKTGWMQGIQNDDKDFNIPPAPPKIKFHALSVFKSLISYYPTPMTPSQRPRNTYALWAGIGMQDLLGTKNAGFLPAYGIIDWQMGDRHENNGPAGWEEYIGGPVKCATMPCDHLSLLMSHHWIPKSAEVIKGLLKDAMDN
uniref:Non-reducing polyketide synthase men2 n=1 Tax=Menisporopsis theobromae TaxID=752604 RepID=MEN2_MENTH|nr:RecName: Full=Non-reducing polyketide synthase men2; Short=NR-PKS men2 [Menisporopsis theobromae]CAB3277416.1 Men2 [Menisporopsis theobromae]